MVESPTDECITEHQSSKLVAKARMVPIVAMSIMLVNITLAKKIYIPALMVLISIEVAIWMIR